MRPSKVPLLGDPNISAKWDTDVYEARICPQCGRKYKHRPQEINYVSDFDKTILCSYNCRCAYYKTHEKERAKWKHENSFDFLWEKRKEAAKKQNAIKKAEKAKKTEKAEKAKPVRKELTDRELKVLNDYNNGKKLKEIGKDLGVSMERARQIKAIALKKLKELNNK